MKKIDFVRVTIQDFMSIKDSSLVLDDPGIVLLLGRNEDSIAADDNGAGKSSVAEALRWCLYGETVRGVIDKSLPVTHVLREGAKEAKVHLEFFYDKTPVVVQRTRTKSRGQLAVQVGAGASLLVGDDAQATLDNMLNIDVMQFANLVGLDGSYPYLFAPATDRERKEILADLVDIAITEHMQEEVKSRLSPVTAELESLKEVWIEKAATMTLHSDRMKTCRSEGVQIKLKLNALRKQEEKLSEDVVVFSDEVVRLTGIDEDRAAKYEVEIEAKKIELKELNGKIRDKWEEKNNAMATFMQSEREEGRKEIYSKQSTLKAIIKRIEEIKQLQADGKCGTCGQDTTEVQTHELELLTSERKKEEHEIEEHSSTLEAVEQRREDRLGGLRTEVAIFDEARDSCEGKLEELQRTDRHSRKGVLDELETVGNLLATATSKLTACEKELSANTTKRDLLKDQYKDSKIKREELDADILDLETRRDQLESETSKLEFWKKGFGPKGVASLFIETVLPHISAHIQKYANILTGGDVIVSLQAYKETKSKTIREAIQISAVNSKGASVYGSNSTGERNRINLAVTLGLITYFRSVGVFESSLLICDEIFDGLDSTGVEQALQALSEASVRSVFVVSHHSHLKPLFDDTIYVVKKDGVSEIRQ